MINNITCTCLLGNTSFIFKFLSLTSCNNSVLLWFPYMFCVMICLSEKEEKKEIQRVSANLHAVNTTIIIDNKQN